MKINHIKTPLRFKNNSGRRKRDLGSSPGVGSNSIILSRS